MTFQKGKTYTHKNMLDVMILVDHISPSRENCTALGVQWFNQRGMNLGIRENVKITKEELNDWYEWKKV